MSIDLDKVLSHPHIEVDIRKKSLETGEDGKLRRFKEIALFSLSIVVISCAFIYCSWRLIEKPEQGWPLAIDSSIISGLLGYLIGKK